MIQNKTARCMMFEWHSGQFSPFYEAASSGLVENFESLLNEASTITDEKDKQKLIEWITYKRDNTKFKIIVNRSSYFVLPWVSRSYFN